MSGPLGALRERLDIVPSRHHTRPVLVGTIVIVVATFALVSAVTHDIPVISLSSAHTVRAEFAAANQVSKRTVVRVHGIEVGRVADVQAGSTPDRTSLVTMRITDDKLVLHRDASAQIRWRTLLGGLMYIELEPGSPSAGDLGDGIIPASRTSNQVELDQVLQPYDGGTAQAQRDLLKGLRATLADPRGVNRTIDTLPALHTVALGMEALRGRLPTDLRRVVAATAKTVAGLNDTQALRRLVEGGDRALAVTDAQRRELGELLELAPGALDSTFTTMRRLRTTLDHLDPLAARLRPGARALAPAARAATPTFVQTEAALREARPLLRAAGPALDALRGASVTGVPLMEGLDPTLSRLDAELLPYLRRRDPETRLLNYESIGPFFSDLAAAAAEFDREGHRIRLSVPPGVNSFVSSPAMERRIAAGCLRRARPDESARCAQSAKLFAGALFGPIRRKG